MITNNRRYDIDWLRVVAIGLLLIYHIAIVFQPWGVFIGFLQNDQPMEALWVPMAMLNVWRIPLLFFVSGMGVCFAMRKRSWKQLIGERTRRIFIPFLFGMLFIVPIHVVIWQYYYSQDLSYLPNPGHLWFLGNIFIYVLVLSPLFFYLKRDEDGQIKKWLSALFGHPAGFLVIIIPSVLEALIVNPEPYELYAMTLHGFWLGMLAFFFGFISVYSGDHFWKTVLRWRWLFFALALVLYVVRLVQFELKSPDYLMAIESNLWVFTVFGFGHKYLNRPNKTLNYLSQAAYPVYIIHMVFLYLGSYLILPLDLPVFVKFILVIGFTGIGCFAVYDLIIRRVNILRPLFGLKSKGKPYLELKSVNVKRTALFLAIFFSVGLGLVFA